MLVVSAATVTPSQVEVGKQFIISIKIDEIDTTWEALKRALPNWNVIKEKYTTWKQVNQR